MLTLTLEHDYLTIPTADWLDDRSEVNAELTANLAEFLETLEGSNRATVYANADTVGAWLVAKFGETAGLHGDGSMWEIHTGNEDTFLSSDISMILVATDEGTLLIETGQEYFSHSAGSVVVRDFTGYGMEEAAGFSTGYLSHDGEACDLDELILQRGGYDVWQNGGSYCQRLEEFIFTPEDDEDGEPALRCPECGGSMTAYVD